MRFRSKWFGTLVALSLVMAACGDGDDRDSLGEEPLRVSVPATLTGALDVSVEEGPVGEDDVSEVNFGSIELDDGFVLIEIGAATVRAAGLTRDELVGGGRFQVELDGESEYFDPSAPTYSVSSLEPLD